MTVVIVTVAAVALIDAKASAPSSRRGDFKPPVPTRSAYGGLPPSFEENRGQTDPRVKFLAHGGGYTLFLTPTEAVLKLRAPSPVKKKAGALPIAFHPESIEQQKFSVVRIHLEGAKADAQASGIDQLPGHSNYFIGKDRTKWRTAITTYGGARFEGIYPGINLVYRGTQGRLEYDFVVAPNAGPSRIKMNIEGTDDLALDREGNLVLKTASGEVIQKAPLIYQEMHGARHPVAGGYVLTGKHSVAFKLGAYDRSVPLTIDPLMTYVSYLGGSGGDVGNAVAVDSSGAAWVTGNSYSTDFPMTSGNFQSMNFGNGDIFITKVSPDGSTREFSTYAGGSQNDAATGIAIDPLGNAYVTGTTQSSDYPVTQGAYDTTLASSQAAFVTGLDPNGGLIYSTFVGGTGSSSSSGIAVDATSNAFLTGNAQPGFPASGSCTTGEGCAFVAELNPIGTELISAQFLGGASYRGDAVGVDGQDNVYLLAEFNSKQINGKVAQIEKIDNAGSVVFSTEIVVGPYGVYPLSLSVDSAGDARFLIEENGSRNVLFYLDPNNNLTQQTAPIQGGNAIALGPTKNLFLAGQIARGQLSTTPSAYQVSPANGDHAFLAELDPTGQFVLYATYLAGSGFDAGLAVAVDSNGNAYVTGNTNSDDFDVTEGVFQPSYGGDTDAFVARIDPFPTIAAPISTATATATVTATLNATATATLTATATVARTPLPTRVPSQTASPSMTPSQVATLTSTAIVVATPTSSATPTITPTSTPTPVGPFVMGPPQINFGKVKVGSTSRVRFVQIANPKRNRGMATISGMQLSSQMIGASGGFTIEGSKSTCATGTGLARGKWCWVAVTFTPPSEGITSDNLMIWGNVTNSGHSIGMVGIGK
jgi:hypothetical protein